MMGPAFLQRKLDLVSNEYAASETPWIIGYSGGKDSSLVLKLVYEVLTRQRKTVPVKVVYCDTGVEIPIVATYVRKTVRRMQREAKEYQLPITFHLAKPPLKDRYFVRVIGRGYPPPTNKFRWCTDILRINPVQRLVRALGDNRTIVLLGLRAQESTERRKTLSKHGTGDQFYYRQSSVRGRRLFCPIVDLNSTEVWEGLYTLPRPVAVDVQHLGEMYKQAGGECPIIREAQGSPCGHGRFGCWTCTVVRKDKAMGNLVNQGFDSLKPLLAFRNWLIDIRDEESYRCKYRRNGAPGLGPFTLSARKRILRKLRAAEKQSGIKLILEQELKEIKCLWADDRESSTYFEG